MFGGGGGSQYSQASQPAPNEQVREAQQKLADLGIYHSNVDGMAGPDTHNAISQFQQQHGLTANGMLDPQTDQALLAQGNAPNANAGGAMANNQPSNGQSAGSPSTQSNAGQNSQGSQPMGSGRIRQAQQKLVDMGLYHATVDGRDGRQTQAAIRQFQQQHGLPVTGMLDQRTGQALMAQNNPPNAAAGGAPTNTPANHNPSLGANPAQTNNQGSAAPDSGNSSAGAGGSGAPASH
jgi:peptidoglycan hydrolase-like protein with peptidoglycan-binding domain